MSGIDKILGVFVAIAIIVAVGYFVWSVGYQGEHYEELSYDEIVKIISVDDKVQVTLPKSDNTDKVWVLIKDSPKLEKVSNEVKDNSEIWIFKGVEEGNVNLVFSWSLITRGVYPDDERRTFNLEVR